MKKQTCGLYPFLQATAGNWRNAAFIQCADCPHHGTLLCSGFLFTVNAECHPIILSVEQFYKHTGEYPDKTECAVVLDRSVFESIYAQWLKWKVDNPSACILLLLTT
ncbi:hypothetical protein [Anaerotignum sp.]|uniref:hypothetical protein n=1 Tax=Anaerotignum sp. TaxID=2039241 RepID=UPI0028B1B45D|nr:hypothetical protein [Anaerotignum sp.]